jgi:endogenous inhibitor of DNA gyrase (YacG/DUF329 family)
MPRICAHEGCGRRLLRKDGRPDYRRHFCSRHCKKVDKREHMQAKRENLKSGRCPTCGHNRVGNEVSDTRVPRHNRPTGDGHGPD